MSARWFAAKPQKLIRRLEHIQAGHGRVGFQVSRENAEALAAAMRRLVHKRTWATHDSIQVVGVNQYTAQATASGPGAVAEQYGTRHRPPHPFGTDAVAEVQADALTRYRQALGSLYQEAGG
jgi:hypothetical protein